VNAQAEVRQFLVTRRARLTPETAGLPTATGRRRVPGLRREELASLAGVSVDYYIRLERGNLSCASDGVLEAIARALQLNDVERAHLFDLARAAQARAPWQSPRSTLRPGLQAMVDAMTGVPAIVRNQRLDILAGNRLGRALYSELYRAPARPVNLARFAFLEPRAHDFWVDWPEAADATVGVLRTEAARSNDPGLTSLVDELCARSEQFRARWAAHDVRLHEAGTKQLNHPVVGSLEVQYETLQPPIDPGLTMHVYTARPGSASALALERLTAWSLDQLPEKDSTHDRHEDLGA
jgi:transcriptional regulator with XRE-family HTH domain